MNRLIAAMLCLCIAVPAYGADYTFPALTGHVVDTSNVIPADQEAQLDKELIAFEKNTGHQVVVVTIPDLNGADIKDYTLNLGRHWGIGRKGVDDGVILLQSSGDGRPGSGKIRIEVGYGLEYILTDGATSLIQSQVMIPILRQDKPRSVTTPQAIIAGTHEILKLAAITPAQKAEFDRKEREEAERRSQAAKDSFLNFLGLLGSLMGLTLCGYGGWWLATAKSRREKKAVLAAEEARRRVLHLEREEARIAQAREDRRRALARAEELQRQRSAMLAGLSPSDKAAFLAHEEAVANEVRQTAERERIRRREQEARESREREERRRREAQSSSSSSSYGSYSGYSSPSSSSSSSSSDDSFGGGGGSFGGGGSDSSY